MKNKKILLIPIIGLFLSSFSFAQMSIDRTIQDLRAYIQKIIFTDTWAPNWLENIVIDGSQTLWKFWTWWVNINWNNGWKVWIWTDTPWEKWYNFPTLFWAKFEVSGWVIRPSGSKNWWVVWKNDLFWGWGDLAWMQYFSENDISLFWVNSPSVTWKEKTTLEIWVSNDPAWDVEDKLRLVAPILDFVTKDYTNPNPNNNPSIRIDNSSTQHFWNQKFSGPTYMSWNTYIDNLIWDKANINDIKVNNSTSLNGTTNINGTTNLNGTANFSWPTNMHWTTTIDNLVANIAKIVTANITTANIITANIDIANIKKLFADYAEIKNIKSENITTNHIEVTWTTPSIFYTDVFFKKNIAVDWTAIFKWPMNVDWTSTFNGASIFKNWITVNQINSFFKAACWDKQYVKWVNPDWSYICWQDSCYKTTTIVSSQTMELWDGCTPFTDAPPCPAGRYQSFYTDYMACETRTCKQDTSTVVCIP